MTGATIYAQARQLHSKARTAAGSASTHVKHHLEGAAGNLDDTALRGVVIVAEGEARDDPPVPPRGRRERIRMRLKAIW